MQLYFLKISVSILLFGLAATSLVSPARANSSTPLRIAFVSAGAAGSVQLQSELEKLFTQGPIVLRPIALSDLSSSERIADMYAQADIVVAWGLMASNSLGSLRPLSKPTILSLVPQPDLLNLSLQPEGGSGVRNLSYIHAQRSIDDELDTFFKLFTFKHVALLVSARMQSNPALSTRLMNLSKSQNFQTSVIWLADSTNKIPPLAPNVDAVFVGPLGPRRDSQHLQSWLGAWSARGLPTYVTLGRQYENLHAAAGTALGFSRDSMVRRVALNIVKIVEGARAESLPVELADLKPQLILNMAVLKQIQRFPGREYINQAALVQVEVEKGARSLDLRQAIALALQKNFALQAKHSAARASLHDVGIARSALLPQLGVSTGIEGIDETSVITSRGSRSPVTWTGQVALSQAIFVEPLWASLAIQKLMAETRQLSANQSELDTVLATADAYLAVLRGQAMTKIENRNVDTTRQNLNIAQRRLDAGAGTRADVARWESQLALHQADLNDALAGLQASRYRLKQVISLPQAEPLSLVELHALNVSGLLSEGNFCQHLGDPIALERVAEFFLAEALNNLPELDQLRLNIQAQERLIQSQHRNLYLPQVHATAQASLPFYRYGEVELPANVTPVTPSNQPTWLVGLALSLPLYEGGAQRHREHQLAWQMSQLTQQRQELEGQVELHLRSQLQRVAAAFSRIALAQVASRAAKESLASVQRAYAEGQVPVSQLIDAQQGALLADLATAQATYQYVLELLRTERSAGFYYFLLSESEQHAAQKRAQSFLGDDA